MHKSLFLKSHSLSCSNWNIGNAHALKNEEYFRNSTSKELSEAKARNASVQFILSLILLSALPRNFTLHRGLISVLDPWTMTTNAAFILSVETRDGYWIGNFTYSIFSNFYYAALI